MTDEDELEIETEITQEMIEAGVGILETWYSDDPFSPDVAALVVSAIFRDMLHLSSKQKKTLSVY